VKCKQKKIISFEKLKKMISSKNAVLMHLNYFNGTFLGSLK